MKKIDLTEGSVVKKLLMVAIPTLITSLVQMAYNLTDMFWVGKVDVLGLSQTEAVSAVGTAGFFTWLGFGLILIVKSGSSILISQEAGKNNKQMVNKYATSGMFLMFLFALVYSLIGIFFGDEFIDLFHIEEESIVRDSIIYIRIVSFFGISFFLFNEFNGINDGLGKTIETLLFSSIGLVLNMILDPIFIIYLELSVKGAAIATVISQTTILVVYSIRFSLSSRVATIDFKKYLDMDNMKRILRIGFPIGIQSIIFASISVFVGIVVTSFGDAAIASNRVGAQIESFAWMVASGFQVALAAFVGQNYGAKKYARIVEGYRKSMYILIPYGLIISVAMYVGAEELFRIFIDEQETVQVGVVYLQILSLSQLFMIIELATAGAFNGIGKTYIPSSISIVGNSFRIPLALYLSAVMGVTGIWWTYNITSIIKGLVIVICFVVMLLLYRKKFGKNLDRNLEVE